MTIRVLLASILLAAGLVSATNAQASVRHTIDIRAQGLGPALAALAQQTGIQLVYPADLVAGLEARAVSGSMTSQEALTHLLATTKLKFEFIDSRTVTLSRAGDQTRLRGSGSDPIPLLGSDSDNERGVREMRLAQADDQKKKEEASSEGSEDKYVGQELPAPEETGKAIPEFLVKGNKSLNTDIERTEDDTQPYVVFDGEEIKRSGAASLEEFFATRLPMNTQQQTALQNPSSSNVSAVGGINLRGLGTKQTLILVNGRRTSSVGTGFQLGQPNIRGIAPSFIERIEVLPATASGIYGGGATGGVINIILKHEYEGLGFGVRYGNTFDGGVGQRYLSLDGGFNLDGGRTRIMLGASHADQDDLLNADRDFSRRSAELLIANDPTSTFIPFLYGETQNISSSQAAANLILDDGSPLNSRFTFVSPGYAGFDSDGGAALVENAGQHSLNDSRGVLLKAPDVDSVMLSIRREVTSSVEAFIESYWDRNVSSQAQSQFHRLFLPASSPDNPFQQDIFVNLPLPDFILESESKIENTRTSSGVIVQLPLDWSASLDYSWSRSSESHAGLLNDGFTPNGEAALASAALRDPNAFPLIGLQDEFILFANVGESETTLSDASVRFGGPTWTLPGGTITVAGLLERREEKVDDIINRTISGTDTFFDWIPPASQTVQSGYLEARAPIVSRANARTFVQELEIMASVRRDEYATRYGSQSIAIPTESGPFPTVAYAQNDLSSSDYTLGLRYSPVSSVMLRASYGTGFLAPDLVAIKQQQRRAAPNSLGTLVDPRRGGTPVAGDASGLITFAFAGNSNLLPEQSANLSLGIVLTPKLPNGLRLSVDYTKIGKTDENTSPPAQFIVDHEGDFPGRVVRGGSLPGDDPAWAGPITFLDASLINLAQTDVTAYDFQVDYDVETDRWGAWHFYLLGTRQSQFERQALPGGTTVDSLGFFDGPLKWRGNLGLDWKSGPWLLGWNTQYFGSYSVFFAGTSSVTRPLAQGSDRIPSQTYSDVFGTYRFENSGSGLASVISNAEITLGVQNVFDESPPILAASLGRYSTYGDPRMRRFTVIFNKQF